MIRKTLITIGFSSHRIEVIPFAKTLMENHELIIAEEAPNPAFNDMLDKKIPIKKYLDNIDTSFPEFSRRMYQLLRELYKKGKKIFQIEPYVERLIQIHERFFKGECPADVIKIPELKDVYETEKKATKALLHFYESSLNRSFPLVIEAVKNFARADAKRFQLRDTMRAKAISEVISEAQTIFIEAGAIHTYLEKVLRKILGDKCEIKPTFLLEPVVEKLTGKKQIFAPGDIITEHYIFNRRKDTDFENLRAARALIYIQILKKEEMMPTQKERTPHLKDEIRAIELSNKLTFHQCEEFYQKIRFLDREKALEIIQKYISSYNH